MKKFCVNSIAFFAVIVLTALPSFSQGDKEATPAEIVSEAPQEQVQAAAPQSAVSQDTAKPEEASIYGEVQAVNAQANSITVQYYDYDNDEEKTMEVALDKDSKLENVKVIDEIKKGDWADITCVSAGGKNIAKLVSVEKEELGVDEDAPAATEE